MVLPVVPLVRPSDLLDVDNGALDPTLLVSVGDKGLLHHVAARAFKAMCAAAAEAGIRFTYTYGGTYRPLGDQIALFKQRYTLTKLQGRPTKTWNGQTWYQLPSTAMAAVPGTSNHGLALAVDLALGSGPFSPHPVDDQAVAWLVANAGRFGFSGETQSEPWHWRYVTGDRIPQSVVDRERPTDPPPIPILEEDDMNAKIIAVDGDVNRAEALLTFGADGIPNLRGFNSADQRDALIKCGVARVALTPAQYDGLIAMATS